MIALSLNTGSSSVKAALFEEGDPLHEIARYNVTSFEGLLRALDHRPDVVGYRVVHGGEHFQAPTLIDEEMLKQLGGLAALAPLHIPLAIRAINESRAAFPDAHHVACFDTAFHSTLPRRSYDLGLPQHFREQGIRRYGFHGLNCEHIVQSVGSPAKTVIAHLGSGCSVTAIENGKSLDTTMSFTPNSGFPMGTRIGDLDPGVIFHLLRQGRSVDEIENLLTQQSGLAGWSRGTSAMQTLLALADSDEHARFAIDAFCFHTAQAIARMVVSLGGLELLVFTGGIGEHCETIRDAITNQLTHLTPFAIEVVAANEERVIANHALAISKA